MTKLRKMLIAIAASAVVAAGALVVACGADEDCRDYEYKPADLSGLSSDELEASAPYGAFYRPDDGVLGDVSVYYEEGVYYIIYVKDGEDYPSRPLYLVETTDFISYTERGEVFSAAALAGEGATGVGSVVNYFGDKYMFYTASNNGEHQTVRLAVSEDGFSGFKRKQEFIIRAEDYGFERGVFDPEVYFDEGSGMFIAVVSTYYHGRPALAQFYIGQSLNVDSIEPGSVLYVDGYGFDALRYPSLFELNGEWYITYYAEDSSLSGYNGALTGASGKMYYLHGSDPVGPFAEGEAPLDSAVFCGGKAVAGDNTMLVGRLRTRAANSGYGYGAGGNIAAHVLSANADGSLALSAPMAYAERFSLAVPTVTKTEHTFSASGAAVEIAKELPAYRLNANVEIGDANSFGFVVGNGGEDVKVTVDMRFGKITASVGGAEIASSYLLLDRSVKYNVDIYAEGSAYAMYIGGNAFSFRARNTGNKTIAAFADGGTKLSDIKMFAAKNGESFNGSALFNAGGSKKINMTAQNDCYALASAALYSESKISVTLSCGEDEKSTSGTGFVFLNEYIRAGAGERVTLKVSSDDATAVYGNMSISENYIRPLPGEFDRRITTDRGSAITVKADGWYTYEAMAAMHDITDGALVVTNGSDGIVELGMADGFARATGSLYARKGDMIIAGVDFKSEVTDYKAALTLYPGAACNIGGAPAGSSAGLNGCDLDVTVEGNRQNGGAAATAFGSVQGAGGFVYTYGRAADELLAIADYSQGSYTAASGAVTVGANRMTAGGGYLAGVTYIAATDGIIDIKSSVAPEQGGSALVRLYQNRIRLAERVVSGEAEEGTVKAHVRAGDRLSLLISPASGNSVACGYTFELAEGEEEKPDLGEVFPADYSEEFYDDLANANRWVYGYSYDYNFGTNNFKFKNFDRFSGDAWQSSEIGDIEIKKDWMRTENSSCDAAIGFRIGTTGAYSVGLQFRGTNAEQTRMAARVLVVSATGVTRSAEFIGDGASSADWNATREVYAQAGDTVYVIFFREGAGYHHGHFNMTVDRV